MTGVTGDADITLDAETTASLDIADNDTAVLSIGTSETLIAEGGDRTIVVTLRTSDGSGGTATLAPGVTLTADVAPVNLAPAKPSSETTTSFCRAG